MDWLVQWPMVDGGQQAPALGMTDVLAWATIAALLFLVPLVVLFSRAVRRRRFWCAVARREVEVELEERGLPGFRWSAAVRSCPVFDPPTAVACGRQCLDSAFRRRWERATPAHRAG